MDKPRWIERLLDDGQAYESLLQLIDENESSLLEQMRHAIETNDIDSARVFAGESKAWKKLRHQLKMYEREEEQYGIIQEQRTR